jgi:putative membrane protein
MEKRMNEPIATHVTSASDSDRISVELSSRRTGMSFQRTRLSADRTLMSVIRTSLSLISFGFTIFQVFQKAHEAQLLRSSLAAHNFGLALVLIGTVMLLLGIVYHLSFMAGLRRERAQMKADGLIHGESAFPVSLTLVTAAALLAIGLFALASMLFNFGPFGSP